MPRHLTKWVILVPFIVFVVFIWVNDPWQDIHKVITPDIDNGELIWVFNHFSWPVNPVGLNIHGETYFPPNISHDAVPSAGLFMMNFLYLFSVMIIGYLQLSVMFYKGSVSNFVRTGKISSDNPPFFAYRLFAGFIIGYLSVSVFNRLVTFIFHNAMAHYIIFIVLFSFCIAFFYFNAKRILYSYQELSLGSSIHSVVKYIILPSLFLAFVIILQIQFSNYHVTGDATDWALRLVKDTQILGPENRFPLLAEHYDELLFNYPMLYLFRAWQPNAIMATPYWLTHAFCKFSIFFFIYILLYYFTSRASISWAGASIMLIGTFNIVPMDLTNMFGAGNPMLMMGANGYIIGNVLPWVVIWLCASNNYLSERSRFDRLLLFFCAGLLACGIATTSINNSIFAVVTGLAYYLVVWYRNRSIDNEANSFRRYFIISSLLFFIAFLIVFGGQIFGKVGAWMFLVAIFVMSLIWLSPMGKVIVQHRTVASPMYARMDMWQLRKTLLICFISTSCALLLLGQEPSVAVYRIIGQLSDEYSFWLPGKVVRQYKVFVFNMGSLSGFGFSWAFEPVVVLSRNIAVSFSKLINSSYVVIFYRSTLFALHTLGLLFSMVFYTVVVLSRKTDQREAVSYRFVTAFMLIMLVCGYYLSMFTSSAYLEAYVKMRLFEPWFHSLMLMFFVVIGLFADKFYQRMALVLSFVWCFAPFLNNFYPDRNYIFKQWALNWDYVYKMLQDVIR